VVVKKNCFCVFSILMFGEEAVCPDGLFVPAVFEEVHFYLNSLIYTPPVVGHSAGDLKLPTSWVSHILHFWRLTSPNAQKHKKEQK
jgi:hypothetical protein